MKKESGYSLLELSVALGIAAVLAAAGIFVSTAFVNTSRENSGEYIENAEDSIRKAEDNYLKTMAGFYADVIADFEDVSFSETTTGLGAVLFYNGSSWVNGKLDFNYITEVDIDNPKSGDVITWDGTKWVNGEAAPPNINALTDVQISGSQKVGQTLIYDGEKWVEGNDGQPGMTKLWTGSSAPEGWLVADGSAVSRTTYAELFATIGTTYGEGNGSTTFNLPDFSGRAGVGLDSTQTEFNSLGKTGGAKTHTLTVSEIPSHTHTQDPHGHSGSAASAGAHIHTGSATSAGAHTHTGTLGAAGAPANTFPSRISNTSGATPSEGGYAARAGTTSYTSGGGGGHAHSVSTTAGEGAHTHTVSISAGGVHSHAISTSTTTAVNNPTGGDVAHNNLQPYVVLNYIIKY